MNIQVSTVHGRVPVTVMHVEGNVDSQTYQQFQQKAEELIDSGTQYLLIDLSHSPFFSSAGLRSLHQIFNKLRAKDTKNPISEEDARRGINAGTYKSPHLKLSNLSKETRTAFELSGFDMFIETFKDQKSAIDSFEAAG
ncbi:MAG TPA: STAS domain-containing protein [Anaerolineales bacterium]|jgi:anti-anti-sigma factor|nr:STAS domain-containing protein [Anaerolineales bacterium]